MPIRPTRRVLASLIFVGSALGQQELHPPTGGPDDWFGRTLDVTGDVLVVGAPREDVVWVDDGAAHIFLREGRTWAWKEALASSEPAPYDRFGDEVATDGARVAVSASRVGSSLDGGRLVHVFDLSGPSTVEEEVQRPPQLNSYDDGYGYAIDILGNWMAIAVPFDNQLGVEAGAVLMFKRKGGSWVLRQRLHGPDTKIGDQFGIDVALHRRRLVVGARYQDTQATNAGAAYVFTRVSGSWEFETKLQAEPVQTEGRFGTAVDIHGTKLVVGCPGDDQFGSDAGAAYAFHRGPGGWNQSARLVALDSSPDDLFGVQVGVSKTHLVVTASGQANYRGAAYIFRHAHGLDWVAQRRLPSPVSQDWTAFGVSAAIDLDRVVIGAHGDDGLAWNAGAAWAYDGEQLEPPFATVYCECDHESGCWNMDPTAGCVNSTGVGARLEPAGSPSVSADDLMLESTGLPPGELVGLLLGDSGAGQVFGDGLLCVAGVEQGLFNFPLQAVGPSGAVTFGPGILSDATSLFGAQAAVAVGQTWNFQAWFTDPRGPCGTQQNSTTAVAVTFAP